MKKEIEIEELKSYMKDHTNKEAAEYFNVSTRTIARRLKDNNLSFKDLKFQNFEMSNEQKHVLEGCLLGDGHIEKNRFKMGQAESRKEYMEWIFNVLKPLSKNIYEEKTFLKKTQKTYKSWRMYTSRCEWIAEQKDRWYKPFKQIPKDLKLNITTFLHWYLQDGTNNQNKKSIRLSTDCFCVSDVKYLIKILKRDLGIRASLNFKKEKPNIHIGSHEYFKVIGMIEELVIWQCFKYKVDTNKTNVKNNDNLGACKLDIGKAKEIRRLYDKSFSMTKLACLFEVSVTTISNIINEYTYKNEDTAKVFVEYRP